MKRIIFHHIPKTGGSYVIEALENSRWDGKPIEAIRFAFPERALQDLTFRDERLLSSHWAFHPTRFRPGEEMIWITWIRDPARMFFSAWHYYRRPGATEQTTVRDSRFRGQIEAIQEAKDLNQYLDWFFAGGDAFPLGQLPTNLNRFDFVGRCEHMHQDLIELGELCGFTPAFSTKARPQSPYTTNPEDESAVRDRLNRLLGLPEMALAEGGAR